MTDPTRHLGTDQLLALRTLLSNHDTCYDTTLQLEHGHPIIRIISTTRERLRDVQELLDALMTFKSPVAYFTDEPHLTIYVSFDPGHPVNPY